NVEARADAGCVMGDAARGARHELYAHRVHLVLADDAARRALAYAQQCVGAPFVAGAVPGADSMAAGGGDASGLVSGLVCRALGRDPVRLFTTATWPDLLTGLGFGKGLGGGGILGGSVSTVGRPDRPFPGRDVEAGGPVCTHVRWVQARLNVAADGRHAELD